jgi:hypothetical protein
MPTLPFKNQQNLKLNDLIDVKEVGKPILDESVLEKFKSLYIIAGKKPFKFKKPKDKFHPFK